MFTSLYYKHCNYSIISKIQNDMQIIFDYKSLTKIA